MLASALWRDVDRRSFQQFQQTLLNALATDVAGDRGVVCLTGYLVYFVNEYDAALRGLDIVVGHLQQACQDALHIFANVAGLGEHRGIDDSKWYVEQLGDCTGHQCLAGACRAYHDDVRLLNFHAVVVIGLLQTLVVIVYGDR